MIRYIKRRPYYEKYIIEIPYEKELKFYPSEIIQDYIFFLGNLQKFDIKYHYVFNFNNLKRNLALSKNLSLLMTEIGSDKLDWWIYNEKYVGLFIYSLLPFKSWHDEQDLEDLVKKINNEDIKKHCGVLLNDKQ